MHELGIAMEIAEVAIARAGDAQLLRVVVEVGRLSAVMPDALAFAWEAAIADELPGCALDIVMTPGRGRCTACAREQELDVPYGRCACGTDLEIIGGLDLAITALEVT